MLFEFVIVLKLFILVNHRNILQVRSPRPPPRSPVHTAALLKREGEDTYYFKMPPFPSKLCDYGIICSVSFVENI